jgi:hypothetical protein
MRKARAEPARAFVATAQNPSPLRAQLAFGLAWTAEWAFTVAIGVVAFRDGGGAAVGAVVFIRMAPAAVLAPVGTALADRSPATASCSGRASSAPPRPSPRQRCSRPPDRTWRSTRLR